MSYDLQNVPARIGDYEIHGRLAAGGMAEVFVGRLKRLGDFEKHVVIKRILPHLASDAEFVGMFLAEARIAAKLVHPNIVQVFDVGRSDAGYFYAMEYVHGEDLRTLVRAAEAAQRPIPLDIAVAIVRGVAAALHHSHSYVDADGTPLRIVHRDVSPSNILVGHDGGIKLLDFGIAKVMAQTAVTRADVRKGKLAYMSPEQCRGEPVDPRSDVFSLGIVLYELSTMKRLFGSGDDFGTMYRIVAEDVRPPSTRTSDYPKGLERIVLKALQRDREQRYGTASELLSELEAWAGPENQLASQSDVSRYVTDLLGATPLPWTLAQEGDVASEAGGFGRRRGGVVIALGLAGAAGLAALVATMTGSDKPETAAVVSDTTAEDRSTPTITAAPAPPPAAPASEALDAPGDTTSISENEPVRDRRTPTKNRRAKKRKAKPAGKDRTKRERLDAFLPDE